MSRTWTLDQAAEGWAPSRIESFTPAEHDAAWGTTDEPEETDDDDR